MKRVFIAGWSMAGLLFVASAAEGQSQAPGTPAPAAGSATEEAAPAGDKPDFKPEELEQMLAPIALYPDSLVSQVLMAATYPIEVVEADRWVKAHTDLKGDALAKELEKQTWDPSVRSLVNFPPVLAMMSEQLTTTVKIGDAFIGQQKEVMDTIQKLRAKAKKEGNLESNEQQKVTVEDSGGTQVIVVESSSPDVIYVPQYNPSVVYGSWPYPSYPPYPYYPPGYVATGVISFGLGVACGVAWGYAWGNCNWGGGDVDIDIDNNFNRNTNIDRDKFKNTQRGDGGKFKHDPSHRQGAAYRNQSSANRVGAGQTSNRASQARSEYRGRAEAGRSDLSRGGADSFKRDAGSGQGARGQGGAADRSGASRPSSSQGQRRDTAISDAGGGGRSANSASSRGSSSRQASPSRSGGGSRPAGGGGGRRGGGGGRRG